MIKTIDEMKALDEGFICLNIQETDLAGHREDVALYAEILEKVDMYIDEVLLAMKQDDILFIMADHGNDPNIKHSKHTRECVPVLVYGKNVRKGNIGHLNSLGDVGATIAEYFGISSLENGKSFLDKL